MEFIALGIFLGLVGAALVIVAHQRAYSLKPRTSLYQVAVAGQTEQSETVQITCNVFTDETPDQVKAKVEGAYALREARLKFQNERLLAFQKEAQELADQAKEKGNIVKLEKLEPLAEKA